MILQIIRQVLFFIPQTTKAFRFMFRSFPNFIWHGGVSVETSFQYQPVGKNETYRYLFRTTVQLDADIINFLPAPDPCPADTHWYEFCEQKYQIHQERVKQQLAQLQGIQNIVWVFSIALSLLSLFLFWKIGERKTEILPATWIWPILLGLLTYLLKRYLGKHIFKRVIILIGFWVKKRSRKRLREVIA